MAQFEFKNVSAVREIPDLLDWTDLGKPQPDWYGKIGQAVQLESIFADVRGIFNDDIIINGKPDPMIFDSFVDFM